MHFKLGLFYIIRTRLSYVLHHWLYESMQRTISTKHRRLLFIFTLQAHNPLFYDISILQAIVNCQETGWKYKEHF